jgi:hypothetical protein
MQPEEPFYLLDAGDGQIPPLFFPMLNKCLANPLLEAWSGYLWSRGRGERLIELSNDGEGEGYAAWRVLPAAEAWQSVVTSGLGLKSISF